MCTSVTFLSETGDNFLARTMDFAFELDGRPVVIPRHQHFNSSASTAGYDTKLAFVGAGRNLNGYVLVDGVNERGLSGAALYFSGEASYSDQIKDDHTNLASYEVLNWLLGNAESCNHAAELIQKLNVVNAPIKLMGKVIPLHWILSDRYGDCRVLEIRADGVHFLKNPVGVMTNSPEFEWHLKNLNNFTELQPNPHPDRDYNGYRITAFGPGSGALGMPGDYTSVSRFVRTAFMRQYTTSAPSKAAVNVLSHILNSVEIPKGVKLKENGGADYTQYRGYMDSSHLTYYMQPYDNQTIAKVTLTEELMTNQQPVEFPLAHEQTYDSLN
ncbi:choloylglycine hydrolase family protein [Lentilactobacillus raoultii]|uniref:Choloylglycine hydrolase family protein n=1 Tax=Lentilactobacillus raoultii TaxID=1987503 RepID=A0ABW3PF87_9LACO|nr:choloylglycine hydrolase family protein [Lentilactobacillus raoultii]